MILPYSLAMAITDLGESTVVLSTAMAVSGWFWISHQRQLAMLWLFALGGCVASMVALKLAFLTCGELILEGTVHTPSGHSSMAALFYGVAALTIAHLSPPAARHRRLMVAVALLLAFGVGATRIVIHAHTPQEVVVGLAMGFGWLALFGWALRHVRPSAQLPPTAVLCLLGALYGGLLTITMIGEHMSVEGLLWHVASLLQSRWGVCAG